MESYDEGGARLLKYGAVILAAGRGARFHGTKQDVIFHGKPLWRWPFDLLCELVDKENIVVRCKMKLNS
ncbi:MAG: NTP transferase domain-containing protein [Selenomonas montiformis]|nr:NTP transferase domain-containing protein [Selenomonas montiformis]